MSFRFIHTADWQIGKSFAQFESAVGSQLRAARLEAIDRIARTALDAEVRHVLVAGDVFDSELIDDRGLRQPLARMAAYPNVTWYMLPGNHDPVRGGGVWERLLLLGVPDNVVLMLSAAPCVVRLGVTLFPAPLAARQTASDPTAWMEEAEAQPGDIRIGVAHGSVRGFGSLGEASVPIEAARRQSARLDYMALGDWHGTKAITPGVWYSGTPERDGFGDNDPGNVLLVAIDGPGAEPRVDVIKTGQYDWIERRVTLSRIADIDPIGREIAALGAAARQSVLRVILDGTINASEAAELDQRMAALAAHPLALRVEDRRLTVRAARADRDLLQDPALRAVADRLIARSNGVAGPETNVAVRAMRRLLGLAADDLQQGASQ